VAALLDRRVDGVSVKPYQPAGYWDHLNFPKRTYEKSSGDVHSTNMIISDSLNINCWDGAGDITLAFKARTSICAIHTGPADLYLTGESGVNYIWNSGNGFIHANGLETGYTYLLHKGTGECHVRAKVELGATLHYIGNVYYTGNPPLVNAQITGSGKLIKAD
jgi:hypothetical protein